MSKSQTTRLKLIKPDPGTGEAVSLTDVNGNWDKLDAAIAPADTTSSTPPATPFPNQMRRDADNRRLYIWNANQASWDQIPVAAAEFTEWFGFDRVATGDWIFASKITTDSARRVVMKADGRLEWGPGNNTIDTNLYRASSAVLQTDGALSAAGGVRSYGNHVTGAENGISNAMPSGSVSSTVYANVPGTSSFSFAKKRADTRIRVDISLSCFPSATNTLTHLGVRVNGVDYDCMRHRHTAAEYETIVGFAYVPTGVPAGNQTIQARWASGGTTNTDAATSWLCLSAREVA